MKLVAPDIQNTQHHHLEHALEAGLKPRPMEISEASHRSAVERVAEMYRRCVAERKGVEDVYQPGGEWRAYIDERRALYDAMLANDTQTASDLLRSFWRNELGLIVKEYASYPQLIEGAQPRTSLFLERVPKNFEIWKSLYKGTASDLAIPAVGDPWGIEIDGVVIAPKATRFHALATQIRELVRTNEHPTVLEIGAGYGGAAHFLLRDEPEINYTDFDLPETLAIAAYALICSNPKSRVTLHGEQNPSSLAQVDSPGALLLPNYLLPKRRTASADVTLNTFSFSEMPIETLTETLNQITRITKGFLLHHNMDRAGVRNRGSERIPASNFPIDPDAFRLIHTGFDLFHGSEGDYREYLYQRIDPLGGTAC